jgi:hypothetical protein
MPFAAFLVESQPRPATLLKIVLHPKHDDGTDTGEGVAHQRGLTTCHSPSRSLSALHCLCSAVFSGMPSVACYSWQDYLE